MMIKAVLFDVDGTLVDSNPLHVEAWVRSFAHFGVEISADAVSGQIGKGGDQLIPVFLSPGDVERTGPDLEAYRAGLYRSEYLGRVRPFAQVRSLFERVRADGRRTVLASSGKAGEMEHYQRIASISDLVDEVVTSDDVEHSKPAPDVFQAALQKVRPVTAQEAVVIGDTPYDAQAASAAGMSTIGVLSGGFARDELKKAGCVAVYNDIADLLANYDVSPLGQGRR